MGLRVVGYAAEECRRMTALAYVSLCLLYSTVAALGASPAPQGLFLGAIRLLRLASELLESFGCVQRR